MFHAWHTKEIEKKKEKSIKYLNIQVDLNRSRYPTTLDAVILLYIYE